MNIDFDNFQSMSQDDKLNGMFAKRSNIEIAQAEMRSVQQQVDRTTNGFFLLFYADDIIIFASSEEELQNNQNTVKNINW